MTLTLPRKYPFVAVVWLSLAQLSAAFAASNESRPHDAPNHSAPALVGTKTPPEEVSAAPRPEKRIASAGKTSADGPASGGSSAANPDDRGVRDPADFPRIPNLTRKTFASTWQPNTSEESAAYSSKLSLTEIVSAYESVLKAAGWEQTMRSEPDPSTIAMYRFRLRWRKKPQSAEVRVVQTKTGANEVAVVVTSARPGSVSSMAMAEKIATPGIAPSAGSSDDQGARDPADFPRIAGSLRNSYTSVESSNAPREIATYYAKIPVGEAEAFYVKTLSPGGWVQSFRRETGDPAGGTHQITMNWMKPLRLATVALKEVQPEIAEINVTLVTSSGTPAP